MGEETRLMFDVGASNNTRKFRLQSRCDEHGDGASLSYDAYLCRITSFANLGSLTPFSLKEGPGLGRQGSRPKTSKE